MLNKLIDWSYEQELRIIVNLKDADSICFSIKKEEEGILKHIKDQCERDNRIEFCCDNLDKITINLS